MTKWSHRNSCPRGDHLPPASASSYVHETPNGKHHAIKKLILPPSDLGVPNPTEIVDRVLDTVDDSYEWPTWTNIHHFCYPRTSYLSDIEMEYRESPTLKANVPIQFHNYLHAITDPPEKPCLELMTARVEEDRATATLYRLGRRAVQLAKRADNIRAQAADREELRWAKDMAEYYEKLSEGDEETFKRIVDTTKDGTFGILPDREWLASTPLAEVVTQLGKVAAVEYIDLRRYVQGTPKPQAA